MTLQILLAPETEKKLRQLAEAAGQDVVSYAAHLLDDAIAMPTVNEALAPVRQSFAATGMTDDELADLLEKAKHDIRHNRRATS